VKLQDFYQKSTNSGGTSAAYASNATAYHNGSPLMSDEQKLALRQFNYCQQLCKVMFEVLWRYSFIFRFCNFICLSGGTS
jgi:hypothetical protein